MKNIVSVSAIILAAGRSARMGRPKQLMPISGGTMLGKAVDVFLGSKAKEVIVVIGQSADEIMKVIGAKPVKIVFNRHYKQGMSTSVRAGLSVTSRKTGGFMFALGDQPFIDVELVDTLMGAFASHGGIVVPVYKGERGHPVIFANKYKKELMALKGDVGGKVVMADHQEDVFEVSVNSQGIVDDIDTIGEYEAATGERSSG